jgi:hypothetical protein
MNYRQASSLRQETREKLLATINSVRNRKDDYQHCVDQQGQKWCVVDLTGLSPKARQHAGYPEIANDRAVNSVASIEALPSETYILD